MGWHHGSWDSCMRACALQRRLRGCLNGAVALWYLRAATHGAVKLPSVIRVQHGGVGLLGEMCSSPVLNTPCHAQHASGNQVRGWKSSC